MWLAFYIITVSKIPYKTLDNICTLCYNIRVKRNTYYMKVSITEFEKLEKVLEENCGKYDTDCNKCPLKKECEKYAEYKELYEMATK